MGDLISRTEVLELIEDIKCNPDVPKNYGTLLDIMGQIRQLPTAYDVEDVVVELEERKNRPPELEYRHLNFAEAIEIVRNGGKE